MVIQLYVTQRVIEDSKTIISYYISTVTNLMLWDTLDTNNFYFIFFDFSDFILILFFFSFLFLLDDKEGT